MAGNRMIAKRVPVNERTFIIGDAELMGYVGCETTAALMKKFIDKGLRPTSQIGKTKYYRRTVVDQFIEDHNEFQQVNVRPGRRKKTAAAV